MNSKIVKTELYLPTLIYEGETNKATVLDESIHNRHMRHIQLNMSVDERVNNIDYRMRHKDLRERFAKAIEQWTQTKKEGTVKQNMCTWHRWSEWCEEREIDNLEMSPENITDFLRDCYTTKRNGKPYKRGARQTQLRHIRNRFKILYRATMGRFESIERWNSVICGDKTFTVNEIWGKSSRDIVERVALSKEQLRELLDHYIVESPTFLQRQTVVVIALTFMCGMRKEETALLEIDDIYFDDEKIYPKHAKNDNKMPVRLQGIAKQLVFEYVEYLTELLGYTPKYLFHQASNFHNIKVPTIDMGVKESFIRAAFDRFSKVMGIALTPHCARYTFATILYHDMKAGKINLTERGLQEFMRHSSFETTMQHYILPIEAKMQQASISFDSILD